MGELLKECLLVKLVEETGWRANRQVASSSNTSNVAGGNLPTFGVMIPLKRAEAAHSKKRIIQVNVFQRISLGREFCGMCLRGKLQKVI